MIIDFTQRWTAEGKPKYVPAREYFNPRDFEIAAIHRDVAKAFCRQFHYSKTVGSICRPFGLFERGKLSGVAIYGSPMHPNVIKNVFRCESGNDGQELNRLVLLDSCLSNSESYFVAECHRRLRKEGYVGVVSFSDDVAKYSETGEKVFGGHLGYVYRSLGAAYLSRASASKLFILPDGTVFTERTISKIRGGEIGWQYSARILENFGAVNCPDENEPRRLWLNDWLPRLTRRMKHPGNLRYAWSFTPKIQLKGLPYPKYKFSDLQTPLALPA